MLATEWHYTVATECPGNFVCCSKAVERRLTGVRTVRPGDTDAALVSIFVEPEFRFCVRRSDGVEAEETNRIESAICIAAMSEFMGAGYFIFSHCGLFIPP